LQDELFVMSSDGGNATRLTDSFVSADTYPTWSPDGRYIAFQANRNSVNDDIYVLENHTNSVFRYTSAGGADQAPAWSPEGTKIAFSSVRDGNFEIYTMGFQTPATTGLNQTNITNNPAADGRPAWSNDARQICWMSNRAGNNDIWIMNADGSDPRRLTTDPAADDFCSIK
jgi:TolB protein